MPASGHHRKSRTSIGHFCPSDLFCGLWPGICAHLSRYPYHQVSFIWFGFGYFAFGEREGERERKERTGIIIQCGKVVHLFAKIHTVLISPRYSYKCFSPGTDSLWRTVLHHFKCIVPLIKRTDFNRQHWHWYLNTSSLLSLEVNEYAPLPLLAVKLLPPFMFLTVGHSSTAVNRFYNKAALWCCFFISSPLNPVETQTLVPGWHCSHTPAPVLSQRKIHVALQKAIRSVSSANSNSECELDIWLSFATHQKKSAE